MSDQYYSYLSPRLRSGEHPDKGGCGLFVVEQVRKGDLLLLWGGKVIRKDEIDPDMPNLTQRVLQVDDGLFLLTPEELEPADCLNHSCEPNAGFTGQVGLVAMRDLAPGEEVCVDYAMCDSDPYDEFDCSCGTPSCRHRITGEDWKMPELQARYDGYFSAYLQRRLEAMKATRSASARA